MGGQRHRHRTMFENPLFQFVVELLRALLIDVLSGHVRARLSRIFPTRRQSYRRALLAMHRRHRERLLNRLHTEEDYET